MKKFIVSVTLALLSTIVLAAPFQLTSGILESGVVSGSSTYNGVDGATFYRFAANKGDSVTIAIHNPDYDIGFWIFDGSFYPNAPVLTDFGGDGTFNSTDDGYIAEVGFGDDFEDFAENDISYLIAVTSYFQSSEPRDGNYSIMATAQQTVPEPGSVALIGLALAGIAVMRRRKG